MSEKEFNSLVSLKLSQIQKAVQDYNNNPTKAMEYINKTVLNISIASKEFGKQSVINELFN